MNFVKQIEGALITINQANFQDLINHFLFLKGYDFIGAPGSVVGKEKTSKGAPDSFFIHGDKYVFVECTTLQKVGTSKTFINKLQDDIEHCFDQNKTKITIDKVGKIIIACNEKISADDDQILRKLVSSINHNTELEIFNIQNLPLEISSYPILCQNYLRIITIKGNIFNLQDYLIKTTKGLQPSLINPFIGRDQELEMSIGYLERNDILLFTGAAGTGKSKLAIQILQHFSIDYVPIVIEGSAVPLWDDFTYLFQNGKNYIILFDDANKSLKNVEYLLDFIQKPKNFEIKLIITVRDYVKGQIMNSLSNIRFQEVYISFFSEEDIKRIIVSVIPPLANHYLIRQKIIGLSKGNARVALMAANSLRSHADIKYLENPVTLYERYFEKISNELDSFSQSIAMQVLSIIYFFGFLDRNDTKKKQILETDFGLNWNDIWTNIESLHYHELLELHSNNLVKVSDQVLGTYAFYRCFVDKKHQTIDYAKWILAFMGSHIYRIKLSLVDINNTFSYQHVSDLVKPHLDIVSKSLSDDDSKYKFYSTFWYYLSYDTLIFIQSDILNEGEEKQGAELSFLYKRNHHFSPLRPLDLLVEYWNHPDELMFTAVKLGIELVIKKPNRLPEFLKYIDDYFKIKIEDIHGGFKRQHLLIDGLSKYDNDNIEGKIAKGTLLKVGEQFLGWHFSQIQSGKGSKFTILNFDLYYNNQLMTLRGKVLDYLYRNFDFDDALTNNLLGKIIEPGAKIDDNIYKDELPIYKSLIDDKLSKKNYFHCSFVKKISIKIEKIQGDYPLNWKLWVESDIMNLADLFDYSYERKAIDRVKAAELKSLEIQTIVSGKVEWVELEQFIYGVDDLYDQQKQTSIWKFQNALSLVFGAIKNPLHLKRALELYGEGQFVSTLQSWVISRILQDKIFSVAELITIFSCYSIESKNYWTIILLDNISDELIDLQCLELLMDIFENSSTPLPIINIANYARYKEVFKEYKLRDNNSNAIGHNIITYLTDILLKKSNKFSIYLGYEFCQECTSYFKNHIDLFKTAYLYLKVNYGENYDHDGKELEAVLKYAPEFVIECVENGFFGLNFGEGDFPFENLVLDPIWSLLDYKRIIEELFLSCLKQHKYLSIDESACRIFIFQVQDSNFELKRNDFFHHYIQKYNSNHDQMVLLLTVIYRVDRHRFIEHLKSFLLLNNDVKILNDINFDRVEEWTGSKVPVLQKKIDYSINLLTMIKSLPDLLDYFAHIKCVEDRIHYLKDEIEQELRDDFIDEGN